MRTWFFSVRGRSWPVLVFVAALLAAQVSSAQLVPLRGPPLASRQTAPPVIAAPGAVPFPGSPIPPSGLTPSGRVPVQLMPGKPTINLLNNGSLQVSQNPNPNFPNSLPYTYIASLPLGDRLTLNGIQSDPQLIPQIGVGMNGPGGAGAGGMGPGGFPPGGVGPGGVPPGGGFIPGQPRFFGAYAARPDYSYLQAAAWMSYYQSTAATQIYASRMLTAPTVRAVPTVYQGFDLFTGLSGPNHFGGLNGSSYLDTATDMSSFGSGFAYVR